LFHRFVLQINWRLQSRKSFALNKMITRNNEIDRRKKSNRYYQDLLPTDLKSAYQGPPEGADGNKENVSSATIAAARTVPPLSPPAAGKSSSPPVASPVLTHALAGVDFPAPERAGSISPASSTAAAAAADDAQNLEVSAQAATPLAQAPANVRPAEAPAPAQTSPVRPIGAVWPPAQGSGVAGRVLQQGGNTPAGTSATAVTQGGAPRPGVPRVKRAMPSVLARWPPAQQQET
jgi:hypothetical protein